MNINPMQIIGQMIGNIDIMQNKIVANAFQMLQQGDMQGLQEMAENLCREKGTSIDDVKNEIIKQFGIK